MHTTRHTSGFSAYLALGLLGASVMTLGACRGDRSDEPPRRFFPDMDHQPKVKAQTSSKFFEDGSSQRTHVDGVVAFGSTAHDPAMLEHSEWGGTYLEDRASMLDADETYAFGLVSGTTDQYVPVMPVEVTSELIERGQERFDIYCSMCHGYDGLGGNSGTVGRLWSIPPANLAQDARFLDRAGAQGSDGYLFHIIREGLYTEDGTIRMPSYGHAIDEHDAWAIVAYLRVLQAASNATMDDVDPSVISSLGAPPAAESTESTDGGEG